ncbi:MAG: carbamoyltransferase N-terminal domain-containing protein [Leadbetterella sp.]|nr:carbamoyltransferase N-terminal domain-containing protein [Leadbetterella sp.]
MIICSLKFTHDGTIALIDNGRLIFSYEMEKLNNNDRFSELLNFYSDDFLGSILSEYGYKQNDINQFVIDGWGIILVENKTENDYPPFSFTFKKTEAEKVNVLVNGYGLLVKNEELLKPVTFRYLENKLVYNSYMHISGHVFGTYCTSPFAKKKENSFILVWDGASFPQVFYFNPESKCVENLGPIFHLLGHSYSVFATNYHPFDTYKADDMSLAGQIMAYVALGEVDQTVLSEFKRLFYLHESNIQNSKGLKAQELIDKGSELLKEFVIYGELHDIDSKDLLATYHVFFQEILVETLRKLISKYPSYTKNIGLTGGCALNIKWNSYIRNSGIFKEVYVSPFPNDAGSAIGAACCEMLNQAGQLELSWNVYSGPKIKKGTLSRDWVEAECSLEQLACILHFYDEPVIFLNGRAELGPRALGNRSLLASPVNFSMKARLNKFKKRKDYRPIAPICIEEDAPDIFFPGSPDPFMLFDHKVREEWKSRIPAVCHLDGTARLQTVNASENPEVYFLLQKFKEISGIPMLCNTSANANGKGFFPDIESAMKWGEMNIIWNDNKIYAKKDSHFYSKSELFIKSDKFLSTK